MEISQFVRRGFAPVLPFLLVPLLALAAESPSGGSPGNDIPIEPPIDRDRGTGTSSLGGRSDPAGIFVDGIVHDSAAHPLEGVVVRLFAAGARVAETATSADGTFRLAANPMFGTKRAIDLWFSSPDATRWVDEAIVLSSGAVDQDEILVTPCTPVVNLLGGAATVEMTMRSSEEKREAIAKSRCLETGEGD